MQTKFLRTRVDGGAENNRRQRPSKSDVTRSDFDTSVIFPIKDDITKYGAPEFRENLWIVGIDDNFTNTAGHARQYTNAPCLCQAD